MRSILAQQIPGKINDDFILPDQRSTICCLSTVKLAFMQQKGIAGDQDYLKGKKGRIRPKTLYLSDHVGSLNVGTRR